MSAPRALSASGVHFDAAMRLSSWVWLAWMVGALTPVGAATIVVSALGDSVATGDGCTLREAIENANGSASHIDCSAGDAGLDTIAFSPALTAGGPATLVLGGTQIVVWQQPLRIEGPGAELLTIDANGLSRIFDVAGSASGSTFEGMTLTGGAGVLAGGAVRSVDADLAFRRVRITGNRARAGGGLGVQSGNLTVIDSEITDNVAEPAGPGAGGGILYEVSVLEDSRTLELRNVTVGGNRSATYGAGIYVVTDAIPGSTAIVALSHVTIADNHASDLGGGLYLNRADSDGVIVAQLNGVILGDNSAAIGPDIWETFDSSLSIANSVIGTSAGYVPDSAINVIHADPALAELAFSAAPDAATRTHRLLAGSPALDLVPDGSCSLAVDQRGVSRPIDSEADVDTIAECDAGAYEDQGTAPFYTIEPCRLLDTRRPPGPFGGPVLEANRRRSFVLAHAGCGIPSTAVAVALNVSVIEATAEGSLLVRGIANPTTAGGVVQYEAGSPRSNNAIVSLSPTGNLGVVATQPSGSLHVLLDVVGYFAPGGSNSAP